MVLPNPAPGNGPPFQAPYAQESAPTPFETATAHPGALTPEVFTANVARMPPQLQEVLLVTLGSHPLISSAFLAAMGPAFAQVIQQATQFSMAMQGQMGMGGPPGMPPGAGPGGPPMGAPPGGPPGMPPGGAPMGPPPGMGGPPPGGPPPGAMPPGAGGPPPGAAPGGPPPGGPPGQPPGQPPGRRPPPPR